VLADAMLWPEDTRPPERVPRRVLVRHLQCTHGRVQCLFDLQPRDMFDATGVAITTTGAGITIQVHALRLHLWSTVPLQAGSSTVHGMFELAAGEDVWAVLELGPYGSAWSVQHARQALRELVQYWHDWSSRVHYRGPRQAQVHRTAMTVHLLTYAPCGSQVAAVTTSLPERIGRTWNADYRLSWVRDTSLAFAILTLLGDW
jgi:hypothetical protein